MSKFIDDAFYGATTGQRRSILPRLSLKFADQPDFMRCQKEYVLKATYEEHGWIEDFGNPDQAEYARTEVFKMFRRKLYHIIFGDFTEVLFRLEKALHEEDYAVAKDALSELWKEVRP